MAHPPGFSARVQVDLKRNRSAGQGPRAPHGVARAVRQEPRPQARPRLRAPDGRQPGHVPPYYVPVRGRRRPAPDKQLLWSGYRDSP